MLISSAFSSHRRGAASRLALLLSGISALALAGCGGTTSTGNQTGLSGNTTVALLASSTANNQISQFSIQLTGLKLTSQSGAQVTVLSQPVTPEFIHLNGNIEPLATATVPQDVYTSATLTLGGASFTCLALTSSGGLLTSTYAYGTVPVSSITVNLPKPVTVTGTAMGLSLDLQVPQSATFSNCQGGAGSAYTITPTFNVGAVTLAAQPSSPADGKATGLQGILQSVDAASNSIVVKAPDGMPNSTRTWTAAVDSNTQLQGIGSFGALAPGLPVDMDLAVQSDGSMRAARLAVYDTDTTSLTAGSGPLEYVYSSSPIIDAFNTRSQGTLSISAGTWPYNYDNATFQVSGQAKNLAALPFSPVFSAGTIVPGQNVYRTSHATTIGNYPTYIPATAMVLTPQTVDGTVLSISTGGGFTVYTVALASYDLFPALAVQAAQNSLLTDPSVLVVYADSSTQWLTTHAVAAGATARFHGLIFNDNGTLRMDCLRIHDGVTL